MTDRTLLLRAARRRDFMTFAQSVFATLEPGTPFVANWHYEHLAWALTRVLRGECRRLIINVPPRSGKSIFTSVALPLFALGHDPTRRVICVSHTEDLARKFSVDRRKVLLERWYQTTFPATQLAGRPRDLEVRTIENGSCFAAGVGGAVLGRGADLIIVDDPLKGLEALSEAERRRVAEFYDNTLVTRLNDKRTGAIVIVMQRLHQDDLVGHVLTRDDWEVVSLPAIATDDTQHQLSDDPADIHVRRQGDLLQPEREPHAVLEQVRRAQGSYVFEAQYQQNPVPAGGNVIKRAWLSSYEDADLPTQFDRVIASWDTASTLGDASDFSAGLIWGTSGLDFYLLDLVRGRFEVPELRREILRLSQHWHVDATIIEDTELGRAVAQDLNRQGVLRANPFRPRFDKEARLLAQSARFEARSVHLPVTAPWLGDYVAELLAFPHGQHDDQVDATSQALNWLTARANTAGPIVRRNIPRRAVARRETIARS